MSPFVISILLYPSCTKTLAQSIMEMEFQFYENEHLIEILLYL